MKMSKLNAFLTALFLMFASAPLLAQQPTPADDLDEISLFDEPVAQPKLSGKEKEASERTKGQIYNQARTTVEEMFDRLCPGRCELVELTVSMKRPTPVGDVTPGFESVNGANFTSAPDAINVNILMDSKLPRNFQANMPRLIQHNLRGLAPKVVVRPDLLDFPEPQLAPMAPYLPEPPQRTFEKPPKQELEETLNTDATATPLPDEAPVEEGGFWNGLKDFLGALGPWIGPILMALVLFGMALVMLRKIGELNRGASDASEGGRTKNKLEIDLDELRVELDRSRALRNRVLRKWLLEDAESFSELVRWVGPDLLSDLKGDPELKGRLAAVSELVASETEPLQEDEIRKIAAMAKARLVSEKVIFDESGAEWEFLEGIGVHNLHRILNGCSTSEKVFVVGQLPQSLRSSYLDDLDAGQRRDLVLGGADTLSKQDAMTLASRLRRAADEVAHIGREADGQAGLVIEMVNALSLPEQVEMLRDLKINRPELSEAVLSRVCLESTTLYIPGETLADALHRTPVETLASFFRGTEPSVRDHLLSIAPTSKRSAVETELSLDVPVGRGEFLESRDAFMETLRGLLLRDGFDLGRANTRAMMEQKLNPVGQEGAV